MTKSTPILASNKTTELLTVVEEATRSTTAGVRFFVEPAEGALRRAKSKQHHIIFGRRGSGKSSLLRKAAADLTVDRRPIAWVDLEAFKGHSYPDLLLSVLIKTLQEFKRWLETAAIAPAHKTSFWDKLFGTKPSRQAFEKRACAAVTATIAEQLKSLAEQLHAADNAAIESMSEADVSEKERVSANVAASINVPGAAASSQVDGHTERQLSARDRQSEAYRRSKIDFLRRNVMTFQAIFTQMAAVSGGDSFLFLDDLYHLRRPEQPLLLDYFHSIGKGHNLWLKVGTIRHRSNWYLHGSPPVGMKLGDDADEIDLDLTLEKYSLTKEFLTRILRNLASSVGMPSINDFITETGVDRLVLASGGVARDFLAIFRRSVVAARERGIDSSRGENVGAEDVNVAAGEYDTAKREEFKRDVFEDEESSLDAVFSEVRQFCLDTANSNCFLVDKDRRDKKVEAIHELVDLKLLHLIRSRVTVNTRQGRLFEAYMLDLSQYAGSRKKRGLELVEFWRSDAKDRLRKASLILYEKAH